jgi:hypothetical protein
VPNARISGWPTASPTACVMFDFSICLDHDSRAIRLRLLPIRFPLCNKCQMGIYGLLLVGSFDKQWGIFQGFRRCCCRMKEFRQEILSSSYLRFVPSSCVCNVSFGVRPKMNYRFHSLFLISEMTSDASRPISRSSSNASKRLSSSALWASDKSSANWSSAMLSHISSTRRIRSSMGSFNMLDIVYSPCRILALIPWVWEIEHNAQISGAALPRPTACDCYVALASNLNPKNSK